MSSRTLRTPLRTAVLLAALLLGAAACGGGTSPRLPPGAAPATASAVRPEVEAARALARWDARRAAAWGRGDVGALRALYPAGSRAGRRDVVALRAWAARGLRVEGVRTQVLALGVLARGPDHWRIAARTRLAPGAAAVGPDGVRTLLPSDRERWQVLDLRRVDGAWRLAVVRWGSIARAALAQRAASPAATTPSTSGSAKE